MKLTDSALTRKGRTENLQKKKINDAKRSRILRGVPLLVCVKSRSGSELSEHLRSQLQLTVNILLVFTSRL